MFDELTEALLLLAVATFDSPMLQQQRTDIINKGITAIKHSQNKNIIKWTLNGDKHCGYNNWLGETPFGRILITWKGWKEIHDACVDEFPGELPAIYGLPDEVKNKAEIEFKRRLSLIRT